MWVKQKGDWKSQSSQKLTAPRPKLAKAGKSEASKVAVVGGKDSQQQDSLNEHSK